MSMRRLILNLSVVLSLSATATGCAYIIPDEPNGPRHNEVLGERRKPEKNVTIIGPQTVVTPPAPAAPRQSQPQAAEPVASTELAPPVAATPARRMPVENQQFQLSSAGFPPIDSVPPRPIISGDGSAQSRLDASKGGLESDRATALEQKETLARDAAAEPSMLSDLPKTDGVVPPNDPVRAVPMAPAAPSVNTAPVQRVAPSASPIPLAPAVIPPRSGAPAPSSSLAPPPAPVAQSPAAPSPVMANASPQAPMRPIILKRPAPELPPLKSPSEATAFNAGDFDPLAVPDAAPVAAPTGVITLQRPTNINTRYIAQSRYVDRR
jgi:hypothetical protein